MMPVTEPKTILLVEDNPDDRDLALMAFEHSKIANEIVVAEDGAAALEYLFGTSTKNAGSTSSPPQIVLLDLNLPKVDGLEVLRRIRSDPRTKRLPVVILTSSDEERDMVESYERGANSYIRKPVDFAQFIESVQQLGLYWLVLNQAPPADRHGELLA
jgi:two-component system response regulator